MAAHWVLFYLACCLLNISLLEPILFFRSLIHVFYQMLKFVLCHLLSRVSSWKIHTLETESLFSHLELQICVQLFEIKRVGYAAVSLMDKAGGSHCFLKIKDHLADFHLSSLTSGSADVILSMLFAGRAVGIKRYLGTCLPPSPLPPYFGPKDWFSRCPLSLM